MGLASFARKPTWATNERHTPSRIRLTETRRTCYGHITTHIMGYVDNPVNDVDWTDVARRVVELSRTRPPIRINENIVEAHEVRVPLGVQRWREAYEDIVDQCHFLVVYKGVPLCKKNLCEATSAHSGLPKMLHQAAVSFYISKYKDRVRHLPSRIWRRVVFYGRQERYSLPKSGELLSMLSAKPEFMHVSPVMGWRRFRDAGVHGENLPMRLPSDGKLYRGNTSYTNVLLTTKETTTEFPVAMGPTTLNARGIVAIDFGELIFAVLFDGRRCIEWGKIKNSELRRLARVLLRLERCEAGPQDRPYYRSGVIRLKRQIQELVNECHIALADFLQANYRVVIIPWYKGPSSSIWDHIGFRKLLLRRQNPDFILVQHSEKNTTSTCGECGHQRQNLALTQRRFNCPRCDYAIGRDINSSRIILLKALADWNLQLLKVPEVLIVPYQEPQRSVTYKRKRDSEESVPPSRQ